jgi:glycosyltransferase involved in cell wall biosynthesis
MDPSLRVSSGEICEELSVLRWYSRIWSAARRLIFLRASLGDRVQSGEDGEGDLNAMDPSMRITHVITDGYLMGGAQLNTFFSLRYQHAERGVELVLGTEGPLGDACRQIGIPVRRIPMKNRLLAPFSDVCALLLMTLHFVHSRPHIVHTHSSKAGVIGRLAARFAAVPVVVHTLHGPPFHSQQSPFVHRMIILIEKVLARHTNMIVTVADAIGAEFVKNNVCSVDRLRTIVSGIDVSTLSAVSPDARRRVRVAMEIPQSASVIVTVGHLSKLKNQALLVEVAALLRRTRDDLYFLIVGTGEVRPELESQIARLGLTDRVLLSGLRDDVPDILAASDIFVQTSWYEGVSRALVEAIYSGLPVVATNVMGTREVVVNGDNGYLVPPGNVDALADRVAQLVDNPEERQRMGRVGRVMVGETRSIEAMGKGLDKLYRELLVRQGIRQKSTGSLAAQDKVGP